MRSIVKFLTSILLLACSIYVYGDDNNTTTKHEDIDLIIKKPTPSPVPKPKAPSYINLSAAVDGEGVVITSNVDVVACVSIFDASTGQSYYSATTSIAPQCRCAIAPTDALLTLQITIGDLVYEGVFSLR